MAALEHIEHDTIMTNYQAALNNLAASDANKIAAEIALEREKILLKIAEMQLAKL